MQAIATLGAVPHLLRLFESSNEVIAEGASETMLHIVTPSDGSGTSHPSQSAVRAAGAIPSLLGVVRAPYPLTTCAALHGQTSNPQGGAAMARLTALH